MGTSERKLHLGYVNPQLLPEFRHATNGLHNSVRMNSDRLGSSRSGTLDLVFRAAEGGCHWKIFRLRRPDSVHRIHDGSSTCHS